MYVKLLELALMAMTAAHAPYSNFQVGAALRDEQGNVHKGCNVENCSYGGTMCAERVALFKAVSEGKRKFDSIAIVSSGGDFTLPCGMCRQALAEFGLDLKVIVSNGRETKVHVLRDLLPQAFTPESLKKKPENIEKKTELENKKPVS